MSKYDQHIADLYTIFLHLLETLPEPARTEVRNDFDSTLDSGATPIAALISAANFANECAFIACIRDGNGSPRVLDCLARYLGATQMDNE